jgi:hypothetical protein
MTRFGAVAGWALALMLCACSGDPAVPAKNPSVWTQVLPWSGLSLVEAPGDLPTHVTLTSNAALVDGDLVAAAGMNIGYGASPGARTNRDVGASLFDRPAVDRVLVVLDRFLPAIVAAAYTWSAYSSDDNLAWSPVAITGAVVYDPLLNRFEIPIQRTQARHLKVVTLSLAVGVTTDPVFTDVFVTELMLFRVDG